jgi:hypothetical protein
MYSNYTIDFCKQTALEHEGKCLSNIYSNMHQKLSWECKKGHQWKARFLDVLYRKSWCPECSGNKKLNGIKIAQEIAQSKKGKCLSTEYDNNHNKLLWECQQGHQWYAPLSRIIYTKTWCPECKGLKKLSINTAKMEAEKRNGKCLSDTYKNAISKLMWQCKKGHRWSISLAEIRNNGSWCPECGRLEASRKMRRSYILYHWKTGEELACVGSYEVKTVEYFNKNRIEFLWQSKTFKMPNDKTYRPDAYLIEEDKWVEIKGYFWQHSGKKWEWFHSNYPNSELWNREKLEEMGILKGKRKE